MPARDGALGPSAVEAGVDNGLDKLVVDALVGDQEPHVKRTHKGGEERGRRDVRVLSARPHALEFLKSEWIDNGGFVGLGDEKDPIAGDNAGDGTFTVPARPLRRRLRGLERFTVTRGGEYAFLPSLSALRWLTEPFKTGQRTSTQRDHE